MADRPTGEPELRILDDQLRVVDSKIQQHRRRMRAAIDVFGLLGFGLAFVGLIVVASLAAVSFASDEPGVGMLFSALTVVALPIVGIAAWHAFGGLWGLSLELRDLRKRQAELYTQISRAEAASPVDAGRARLDDTRVDTGPPSGLGGFMGGLGRGAPRVALREPPAGNSPDGYREINDQNRGIFGRTAALWLLVASGILFLIFIVGVALGTATT
ncbi:hypothetical protein [Cryptosporangium phraense]|uniref:Uncharacterized protein n=1 Tax=Cryptosporangium phraense TaxID=2593070 RepID=A0A545AUB3_9ACTN|nr:hypothetical protein [Cryptosporangium phraense]TQS44185.1 hypothetical protein FL583_14645 [Cryptosporangium phraense]